MEWKLGQRKKKKIGSAAQLRYEGEPAPWDGAVPLGGTDCVLYETIRETIPVVDAAIGKLVQLVGGFTVRHADKNAEAGLKAFLRSVPCGRAQYGIDSFLAAYLDSLLLYGRAVGEMVVTDGRFAALCWGDVKKIHVQEGEHPLDMALCVSEHGEMKVLPYQNLLLFTTRAPEAAHPYGVSLLRSMPFLAGVLMKIYRTVGKNWERAGNVRYSVVCKPKGDGAQLDAAASVEELASAWSQAMQSTKSGAVKDFVAVGDVEIKVIGADGAVLDSEVPVRQILEQLVAATGLPPFLLGLSWSSTERMSAQQADILTTQLWAIRRSVEPVLNRITQLWLNLNGFGGRAEIVWEDISLQDLVEQAHAELYHAQAQALKG